MALLPDAIARGAAALGSTAQNMLEVARFGGLDTGEQASPYEILAEDRVHRLRRYFANGRRGTRTRPPVVLVPPLMLTAEVYDVSPQASAVSILHDHGADPWIVDFGSPEREEGGLERNLADHVVAVSDAVDTVREITGRDVHLAGYSQGGMFCYQTAAYRRGAGISSLVTFGSPVDLRRAVPLGLPQEVAVRGAGILAQVFSGTGVPGWMTRTGFRLLDPVKSLRQRLDFLLALHDREALLPRESQRRFLMGEGWVAWPGPALADFMRQFLVHNRMLQGGFVIENRLVTLADIELPVLCFVGETDEIAPPDSVRPIVEAAPRSDVYEVALQAGHFGLVVGRAASVTTWPVVASWARWKDDGGDPPPEVVHVDDATESAAAGNGGSRLTFAAELAAGAGYGVARGLVGSTTRSLQTVRAVAEEARVQLPRLGRIGGDDPQRRISLGLLLDERARHRPRDVCFLFEDRAYDNAAVKGRIDGVVRGLVEIGVRPGEPIGVLMHTRPTALAVVAALNRLGAVVVLLRPGGNTKAEAELAEVRRIIADPEHAAEAAAAGAVHVFLLRGEGDEEQDGIEDLERGADVALPKWYEPNPGRVADLAFVLFAGELDRPRITRVTNGRWGLSAVGTASAAALSDEDTVYGINPLHHPSGLLTSVGGAFAGGARLAMASRFDPETFWEETRRYGVTVVSYTWAQLRDLVEAPPDPNERHHPIRLFMGSGMPRGVWRRVVERFAPASVLEFWAASEGEAILANVRGAKRGSQGRPLPGSAEVRIVRYSVVEAHVEEDGDGFAYECEDGEIGLLLARIGAGTPSSVTPLRSVLSRGDAWLSTGSLFRRDRDGDHWLVDSIDAVVRNGEGWIPTLPITAAMEELGKVDLAITYAAPAPKDRGDVAVTAISLREGATLRPADIARALGELDPHDWPDVVHVVDELPMTTWYRPLPGPLREAGIPVSSAARPAWLLDRAKGAYKPLSKTALERRVGR